MLFQIYPSPFTGTTLTHKIYEGRKSNHVIIYERKKSEYNTKEEEEEEEEEKERE